VFYISSLNPATNFFSPTQTAISSPPPTSFLDIKMSNNNDLNVLPFFIPYAYGLPSRRHIVIARRADAHFRELFPFFVEASLEEGGLTGCHVDFVNYNKMMHVDSAVEELEECTSDTREQRSRRLCSLSRRA
jgi:hypothetical protein